MYVTEFAKTISKDTRTEIYQVKFLYYSEAQTIWLWMARSSFTDGFAVKPQGCTTGSLLTLKEINRSPCSTKLLLIIITQ